MTRLPESEPFLSFYW